MFLNRIMIEYWVSGIRLFKVRALIHDERVDDTKSCAFYQGEDTIRATMTSDEDHLWDDQDRGCDSDAVTAVF